MSYLDHQDQARRATGSLIFYFTLGFLAVIASVTLAAMLVLMPLQPLFPPPPGYWDYYQFRWILLGVTLATAGSMLLASWWKMSLLKKGGGEAIAKALGGRMIQGGAAMPPLERRLRNVVEEMAIAAETPAPLVFIFDKEEGVNAFAAGLTPHQAVLGITRGAMELLRRDELQALVAHEFSHIKSGDMRLNLRLMGLLHGILFLALAGHFLLRNSVSRHGDEEGGFIPAALAGLILAVVGSLGGLCGKLLKAGVSRQREFLADASAVQFTRNPQALVNVLLTIGGCARGSELRSPRAPEASHMFFADGLNSWLSRKLATHPGLAERIRRIDPMYAGPMPREHQLDELQLRQSALQQAEAEVAGFAALHQGAGGDVSGLSQGRADASWTSGIRRHARRLLERLSPEVVLAARNSVSSPYLLCAILLVRSGSARACMEDALLEHSDVAFHDAVQRLADLLQDAPPGAVLPLLDLAVVSAQARPAEERKRLEEIIQSMIRADRRIDLFEWMLQQVVDRHLSPRERALTPEAASGEVDAPGRLLLEGMPDHCALLLTAMARWGARPGRNRDRDIQQAYAAGAALLDFPLPGSPRQASVGLREVDACLRECVALSPASREKLLAACAACIRADGCVSMEQATLLRGMAAILNQPAPSLLPGQPLGGEKHGS